MQAKRITLSQRERRTLVGQRIGEQRAGGNMLVGLDGVSPLQFRIESSANRPENQSQYSRRVSMQGQR